MQSDPLVGLRQRPQGSTDIAAWKPAWLRVDGRPAAVFWPAEPAEPGGCAGVAVGEVTAAVVVTGHRVVAAGAVSGATATEDGTRGGAVAAGVTVAPAAGREPSPRMASTPTRAGRQDAEADADRAEHGAQARRGDPARIDARRAPRDGRAPGRETRGPSRDASSAASSALTSSPMLA